MTDLDDHGAIPVREATLPGVGKKYVMPLRSGGNLAIVVRPDGERQIYHFLEADDRPCDVIKVDGQEAQQVSNLLGAPMVSAPAQETLDLLLGALEIEWVTLAVDTPLVGRTLGQSQLRKRTGASVVAIMREGRAIANPDVDTEFLADDTLLLIGTPEQTEAARGLLEG